MSDYTKMVSGQVVSAGGDTNVIIPFTPDFVEISNQTAAIAVAGVTRAWWNIVDGQGSAFLVTTAAGPADGTSFVTADGITTFEAALALQYGPAIKIDSMTAASPIVVTTATNHGLVSGNVVELQSLYQTAATGMQQIAGVEFEVTVTGATTFTINWDGTGSNYTAIVGGGLTNLPQMRRVLYPSLFVPGISQISAITTGTSTTIVTTSPHNLVVGQEVAFRVPTEWGTVELNSLPNEVIPGSPKYGFVTSVTDRNTVVVDINSTGFTAYDVNQTFVSFPGLLVPQIVAAGNLNFGTAGFGYASPTVFNGWSLTAVSSIIGPIVQGAFFNNSFRGFIIGSAIAGSASDILTYRAYAHDANGL